MISYRIFTSFKFTQSKPLNGFSMHSLRMHYKYSLLTYLCTLNLTFLCALALNVTCIWPLRPVCSQLALSVNPCIKTSETTEQTSFNPVFLSRILLLHLYNSVTHFSYASYQLRVLYLGRRSDETPHRPQIFNILLTSNRTGATVRVYINSI